MGVRRLGAAIALALALTPFGDDAAAVGEAADFEKVPLLGGLSNVANFEFAPGGKVFILSRYGDLILYDLASDTSSVAGTLDVYHGYDDGLLGIAIDPEFASNGFVYLYYSPQSPSVNRLSRFTISGDVLDLPSEVVMLDVPVQRNTCCHSAGDLELGADGNLYLSTGDDSYGHPYRSISETSSDASAEKSSSNTNDLRGKIVRIHPEPDGSYTIPAGNLFTADATHRGEIYAMGLRNPYRFSVDDETGWLYVGENGADADDPAIGPRSYDEINQIRAPGNYGWPYVVGPNLPYYNPYEGYWWDPAAPTNDSVWNTGARLLPPAEPPLLDMTHRSLMSGPVYHYDPLFQNPARLPHDMDGHLLYWDFSASEVWGAALDANGDVVATYDFAPGVATGVGLIDAEIGPDDQLYLLEYGEACCPYASSTGVLSRIDYVPEPHPLLLAAVGALALGALRRARR